MIYNQVPESVADFVQGRVSKSIGANHYMAKSQQAEFWYAKIVEKFEKMIK
jgi:intergrase/recombinase